MPLGQPPVLDDSDYELLYPSNFGRGYVPRDFTVDPPEMFDPPSGIPDMSLTEIADRIREHDKNQSSLQHLRRRAMANMDFRSLDQNGQGYCWSYSVAMAQMLVRLKMNLPFVRLSAHAVAWKIKGGRDEGGWCGLSAQFARGKDPKFPGLGGYPSIAHWPEKSMDAKYNTAATWENAKLHQTTEEYVDVSKHVADQDLARKQELTCLVLNNPTAEDYPWWSHSVCIMAAVLRGNPSGQLVLEDFDKLGINSWTDSYGDKGEFILTGAKANSMGAICIRSSTPSVK